MGLMIAILDLYFWKWVFDDTLGDEEWVKYAPFCQVRLGICAQPLHQRHSSSHSGIQVCCDCLISFGLLLQLSKYLGVFRRAARS